MSIEIVPIQHTYAAPVIELVLTIQQEEFNIPVTIKDQPDLLKINKFYYRDGGCFWGAFINGKLVGTIGLTKFDRHQGAIRKFFVRESYRGKELGIAQMLLETLIAYAHENGIKELYLGALNTMKAALRFFERNHFIVAEQAALPKAFPLTIIDDIFLHFTLNQAG